MTQASSSWRAMGLALQIPGGPAPLLWGPPGVGKSARFMQIARDLGAHAEVVLGSIREPAEFAGFGVPGPDGRLDFQPAPWVRRALEGARRAPSGRTFVLLDELSCSPPAVQAAMLRPVHEGWAGDTLLPREQVRFAAAANPADIAAGGFELAAPLANRFCHLWVAAPSLDEWEAYLAGTGSAGVEVPRLDPERFAAAMPRAQAEYVSFLRSRPDLFSRDPQAEGQDPAFPSPRTAEYAVRCLAACYAVGEAGAAGGGTSELLFALVRGCVGESVAREFAAWRRSADLPDPEDLLQDPARATHDPARDDRTLAILRAVVGAANRAHPDRARRWAQAWQVICAVRAGGAGPDLLVTAARELVAADRWPAGASLPREAQQLLGELRGVVQATGGPR